MPAKVFQLSKNGRPPALPGKSEAKPLEEVVSINQEPPIGLIQGNMPDSVEEWRFSLALNYYQISYIYQYEIFGGRVLRGGQLIDFWVFTDPMPTPVYIQGEEWHLGTRKEESELKIEEVKRVFKGYIQEPLIVWASKLSSLDNAKQIVRQELVI
jgi:hypothetical protein